MRRILPSSFTMSLWNSGTKGFILSTMRPSSASCSRSLAFFSTVPCIPPGLKLPEQIQAHTRTHAHNDGIQHNHSALQLTEYYNQRSMVQLTLVARQLHPRIFFPVHLHEGRPGGHCLLHCRPLRGGGDKSNECSAAHARHVRDWRTTDYTCIGRTGESICRDLEGEPLRFGDKGERGVVRSSSIKSSSECKVEESLFVM